tara:strand:+ start:7526 stop:8269 length:744 start_codon:yes stop_codon:yes gene_type:complete
MTNIGTLNGPISSTTNDTRRGSGYGSTISSKAGLGSEYNAGDALSSPIGPYDDVENRMFEDQDEDENFSKEKIKADAKISTSLQVPTKDFHSVKSIQPGYYGDMAARVPLAASYNRGDALLREFISEALHEVTSMSVRVMVQGAGLGNTYKKSSANTYYTNSLTPGDPSIKQKGYGQSVGTQDIYPYVKAGKPTTDGGETTFQTKASIIDEFDWNDSDYTTSDHLLDTMNQDYLDRENVQRHNRRFK